ncbi:MAG: hypothetical protein J6Y39_06035 [Bacteroidaceae bacterium]|nr:hypothetical protein [Bacteroidaceae bacterium]
MYNRKNARMRVRGLFHLLVGLARDGLPSGARPTLDWRQANPRLAPDYVCTWRNSISIDDGILFLIAKEYYPFKNEKLHKTGRNVQLSRIFTSYLVFFLYLCP